NFVFNLLATTTSTSPVLTLQPALSCLLLLPRFAVFLNGRRTIASSRDPWQVFFKFISKLDFIAKVASRDSFNTFPNDTRDAQFQNDRRSQAALPSPPSQRVAIQKG
ncbi:MAG: hypothetical protein P4L91_13735, partial [Burkholderiaceae bacterium]|nr:hypothetical protein [Burkholderiaceae bacterium]